MVLLDMIMEATEKNNKFDDNVSDNADDECVTWRSFGSGVCIFTNIGFVNI